MSSRSRIPTIANIVGTSEAMLAPLCIPAVRSDGRPSRTQFTSRAHSPKLKVLLGLEEHSWTAVYVRALLVKPIVRMTAPTGTEKRVRMPKGEYGYREGKDFMLGILYQVF